MPWQKTRGTCHGKLNYIDMANISHGPWQNKFCHVIKSENAMAIIVSNLPWQKREKIAMVCGLPWSIVENENKCHTVLNLPPTIFLTELRCSTQHQLKWVRNLSTLNSRNGKSTKTCLIICHVVHKKKSHILLKFSIFDIIYKFAMFQWQLARVHL